MKIKKYGHACLLIDINGVKLITDPGSYSPMPDATGVAAILITHHHQDHLDLEQVKALIAANPGVRIITHAQVAPILAEAGIHAEQIEPGQTVDVHGVSIESVGTEHAVIYQTSPCRNTGFLIAGGLFIPGDALHDIPTTPVRVLALPTAAPWMKVADAIEYVKVLKPAVVFPIHDAMYTESAQRNVARWLGPTLEGVTYVDLAAGEEKEF
jgi:L-ascorbate metabolism protein UlaG (beta-lactamase superfamily)